MFETLKRLYADGRLNAAGLARAVALGWITQVQADEIQGISPAGNGGVT